MPTSNVHTSLYFSCDVLNLSRWLHRDCRKASDSSVNGTRRRGTSGRGLFRSAARVPIRGGNSGLEFPSRSLHRGSGLPYLLFGLALTPPALLPCRCV